MTRSFHVAIAGLVASAAPLASLSAQASASATQVVGFDASTFKKPSDAELKRKLSPEQYYVTQHEDTEAPFRNVYWNNHRPGIYVDIVSREPLFSSLDKYDSKTGWPSFTRPLVPGNIKAWRDKAPGLSIDEVRSKHANSHLGHLFSDGPPPTGLRYCINSAALLFISADDLVATGYGEFAKLFEGVKK